MTKPLFFLGSLLATCCIQGLAVGQLARKTQEVWPSIDVFYRVNDKLRLYATASGTKKDSSNYTDGSIGIFLDLFAFPILAKRRVNHLEELPGTYLRLRGGYQMSASPASAEDPFQENLYVLQADGRTILPASILLTLRNRFDFRFNEGDFSTRYRPRLALERDFRTEYLFFTVSSFMEYYANLGQSQLNRFRFQLGLEVKVTRHLAYESFWNHQFSNEPSISRVDAFGMVLKLYLDRRERDKSAKSTADSYNSQSY